MLLIWAALKDNKKGIVVQIFMLLCIYEQLDRNGDLCIHDEIIPISPPFVPVEEILNVF